VNPVLEAPSAGPGTRQPGALARILEVARGRRIALAPHTTLDLVEHPVAVRVPGAAAHVHGLLSWHGKRIPYIDVDALLRGAPAARTPARYALVVAFQPAPGAAIEQGAIALLALPESIQISDSQGCKLPADRLVEASLALACFDLNGEPVAIFDTAQLFR